VRGRKLAKLENPINTESQFYHRAAWPLVVSSVLKVGTPGFLELLLVLPAH
jgi:hypothetical protein